MKINAFLHDLQMPSSENLSVFDVLQVPSTENQSVSVRFVDPWWPMSEKPFVFTWFHCAKSCFTNPGLFACLFFL